MSTPTEVGARYRLDRRLGAGGMSTVFLAVDSVLERQVAVKLLAEHLAEDETFVARFRREALAAARLMHPNVVQVYDSGQDPDTNRHYIVMEYVDGPSCADLLRDERRLAIDRTVAICRDACHGLDYAHRAGVIHRDVKPGNLLMVAETSVVKLADFGIAKAAEQSKMTQVGSVLGTAAYLSPEQARGEDAGPPSDVYSLGVCAYQFLTGRLPYEYSSITELALKQQERNVEPIRAHRPEVPPELDRAVLACLERDPNARWGSALELAAGLEAGLRGESTGTTHAIGPDATQALAGGDVDATQRMAPTRVTRPPQRPPAPAPRRQAAPAAQRRQPPARARRGRKLLARLLPLLLVLLAAGIAILALTSGNDGGQVERVMENQVRDQVDGLKDFIQRNRE